MIRNNYFRLLFLLLTTPLAIQANGTFNVKDYGARGNGKKMDTPAIQKQSMHAIRQAEGQ